MLVHPRHDVEDRHGENEDGADESDHEEAVDDLGQHPPLVLHVVALNALAHLGAHLAQMQQDLLEHREVLALGDEHLELVVESVQAVLAAARSAHAAAVVRRDALVLESNAGGGGHLAKAQTLLSVRVEDAQQTPHVAEDERPQPTRHGPRRVLVVQVEHDDAGEDRHGRHHHHHGEVDRCNRQGDAVTL